MNEPSFMIEKINNINSLETIKDIWDSLVEESETKTIELTYEWQITFWKQFNQDAELSVLVIHQGGSIVAISPLKLTTKRMFGSKVRTLEIIGARTSNYQDLIIGKNSAEVMEHLLDYLLKNETSWDRLSLRNIPETATTACFFQENLKKYPLRKITQTDQCAYLTLDQSWEEHLKNLGKHRKHVMKNKVTRIEKEIGKIRLRNSVTDDQMVSDLQEFYNSHRKRWAQTNTPSIFLDSKYCNFYSEAGLSLLHAGQFGLSVLEADHIPLAHLIYFTFKQSALLQLITYDPDYYKYSPSLVLIDQFIDKAPANNINEIDWGTYYSWKEPWVNHLKNKVHLIVFPKRFLPSANYISTRLYLALRSRIKKHPHILSITENFLRRARIFKWFSSRESE